MKNVTFWKAGEDDGCSFYRCDEPARALNQEYEHGSNEIYAQSTRRLYNQYFEDADVIVGQRLSEAGPLELWRRLATGEAGKRPKLIYEIDDDLLNIPEHFGLLHQVYAQPERRARIKQAIEMADAVTTTNNHLAGRIVDLVGDSADIHVIPNYVPERFVLDGPIPKCEGCEGWAGDRVTIGWGGGPSHKQDFEQVVIPLRKALRSHNVDVKIIGPDYTPRLVRAAQGFSEVHHVGWVPGGTGKYIEALDFHLGVAPLDDDLFNRSKSDVKAREYAARGIPTLGGSCEVYTQSPVVAWTVESDDLGYWWEALDYALRYPAVRTSAAEVALRWARDNTLEKHIDEWERVVTS